MTFSCPNCSAPLSAEPSQVGQTVRCPSCLGLLLVPSPAEVATKEPASTPKPPPRPPAASGRRFGFACPYCSSRLDAHESQGGQKGTCPTCAQEITIPRLDRFGRTIDPTTHQIIKPDPHPVHAYAAAGAAAPRLRRLADGSHVIVCTRCAANSPITANACRACGMPFTMEGTVARDAAEGSSLGTASLVLGIVSLPAFCLIVPGPLAVTFGCIALYQMQGVEHAPRGPAIAGLICGGIGTAISLLFLLQ